MRFPWIILAAATIAWGDDVCDRGVIEGTRSALEKTPSALHRPSLRVESNWQRIQDPLDRSMGRIDDEQIYELSRIERMRDERFLIDPRREFEEFQEQRERQLRLDERWLRLDQLDERARRQELDRREYLLYTYSGFTPTARQAEADRLALEQARTQRDQALAEAVERLNQATDREAARREYQQRRREIRSTYEQTRQRILGFEAKK